MSLKPLGKATAYRRDDGGHYNKPKMTDNGYCSYLSLLLSEDFASNYVAGKPKACDSDEVFLSRKDSLSPKLMVLCHHSSS